MQPSSLVYGIGVNHYNVDGFGLVWDGVPLPPLDGVGIDAVLSGSPAHRSGLQAGDVFADVDGTAYRKAESLSDYLSGKKHGDVIRFSVWQYGLKSPSYTLTL
jgi:S1-C subfamily serine protease